MDCWVFLEIFPWVFRENLAIFPREIIINPPPSQSPHPQSIFIPFSITKTNILTQVINYTFFPYQYYEYLITINNIEMKFILCIAFFQPFFDRSIFYHFSKIGILLTQQLRVLFSMVLLPSLLGKISIKSP